MSLIGNPIVKSLKGRRRRRLLIISFASLRFFLIFFVDVNSCCCHPYVGVFRCHQLIFEFSKDVQHALIYFPTRTTISARHMLIVIRCSDGFGVYRRICKVSYTLQSVRKHSEEGILSRSDGLLRWFRFTCSCSNAFCLVCVWETIFLL